MRVKKAKDFLVQQTAEQAQREGVSLSDLEKRMMYFTESEDAVENPIALNEEFEAQYDSAKYESKVAGLMGRAYNRLKEEASGSVQTWDEAIRELKKGDHYILVMWAERRIAAKPWGFWKTMAASFVLAVVLFVLVAIVDFLKHR
ncbi:MAG TPA: hypothetical protein VHP80_20265 [Candidatus Acidoferrum sp.]|jgi:hypothetical protein|nr:hypothetical protein [Candidatus Acidoferrum sp.]